MTSHNFKQPRIGNFLIEAAYSQSQDSENIPYVKSHFFLFSSPFLIKGAKVRKMTQITQNHQKHQLWV